MNFEQSKKLQNAFCIYCYLLSGFFLYMAPLYENNPFSALIITLCVGAVTVITAFLITKFFLSQNLPKAAYMIICLFGFASGISLAAINTKILWDRLIVTEKNYNNLVFVFLFIPLILFLCTFCAKLGYISFSRVSIILIPFLLFTLLVMWLAFSGNEKGALSSLQLSLDFELSYIKSALCLFADVFFLFFIILRSRAKKSIDTKCTTLAYMLFAVTCALEILKYSMFFGTMGLMNVTVPQKTMLSVLPFADVQEFYTIIYLISYTLKNTVYFAASAEFVKKLIPQSKKGSFQVVSSVCIIPTYLLFILFNTFSSKV